MFSCGHTERPVPAECGLRPMLTHSPCTPIIQMAAQSSRSEAQGGGAALLPVVTASSGAQCATTSKTRARVRVALTQIAPSSLPASGC